MWVCWGGGASHFSFHSFNWGGARGRGRGRRERWEERKERSKGVREEERERGESQLGGALVSSAVSDPKNRSGKTYST